MINSLNWFRKILPIISKMLKTSHGLSIICVLKMRGLLILGFLVFVKLQEAFGVKCYQCDSLKNADCGDPFKKNFEFVVDCDKELYPVAPRNTTFCRKNSQNSKKLGLEIDRQHNFAFIFSRREHSHSKNLWLY